MLEFSSTESCTTSNTSTPLVGFSSNDSSCDGNVALMNDFESTEGCSGQGPQGPDGFSAYQIAVFDGFVGTETQWLASLVGPGVPVGGTAGQILAKIDLTNYNTQWINNFALPALTSGSVLFSDGTTVAQNNANFFWNNANNRLGIGTTTPSYALHVNGVTGATTFTIPSYNSQLNQNYLMLYGGYGAGMQGTYNNPTGGDLTFGTFINSVFNEKMRLLPSGNLGIGTVSPSHKLDVIGNIGMTGQFEVPDAVIFSDYTNNSYASIKTKGINIGLSSATANYGVIESGTSYGHSLNINGVTKLKLDGTTGNVGIGETSPLTTLDIRTSLNTTITPLSSVPNASTTVLIGNTGTNGVLAIGHNNTGQAWLQGRSRLAGAAAEDILINPLGGNVGIGTTLPVSTLQVENPNNSAVQPLSTSPTAASILLGNTGNSVVLAMAVTNVNVAYLQARQKTGTGAAFDISLNPLGGNVGIGTTTPASKLHILGDSIVNIVQSSNAVSYTQYYNTSTGTNLTNDGFTIGNNGNDAYIFQRESANLIIGTSNTERLRINSNGNVGINTTNPLEKLQVNGKILVNNGSLLYIDSNAGGSVFANSGALPLTFNTNSADRMIILSNGNVGIGTTTPTAKLDILDTVLAGSAALAGSVLNIAQTWNTTGVPTAIKLNVTDTLSGSGSLLIDLQVGASSKFKVRNDGVVFVSNEVRNGSMTQTTQGLRFGDTTNFMQLGGASGSGTFANSGSAEIDLYGITNVTNPGAIIFKTGVLSVSNQPEVARITPTGNLGIGNNAPTARLQIQGSGITSATTSVLVQNSSLTSLFTVLDNGMSNIYSNGFAGTIGLRINSSGIGSSSGLSLFTDAIRFNQFGILYFTQTTAVGSPGYTLTNTTTFNPTAGTANDLNIGSVFSAGAGAAFYRPLTVTYTLNNTGAQTGTATGIFLNATETALNGMVHNLMDLQVGGVSKFSVRNDGRLNASGSIISLGDVATGAPSYLGFTGRTVFSSPSNGVLLVTNNAVTDFSRLQLGGTTNLFPAIKRSSAEIDFRLADDSGYVNINSNTHVIYHSGDRAIEFVKTGANGYSIEHDVARIYFYNRTTAQVALRIINNGSVSVGNLDAVASALFQIDSTTKGFLPPRMTTAQKVAIATPATGLVVFDTDLGKLCVFAVTWQTITSV
jgi:hypothetical protein